MIRRSEAMLGVAIMAALAASVPSPAYEVVVRGRRRARGAKENRIRGVRLPDAPQYPRAYRIDPRTGLKVRAE
jgi:hypothetical protein